MSKKESPYFGKKRQIIKRDGIAVTAVDYRSSADLLRGLLAILQPQHVWTTDELPDPNPAPLSTDTLKE